MDATEESWVFNHVSVWKTILIIPMGILKNQMPNSLDCLTSEIHGRRS